MSLLWMWSKKGSEVFSSEVCRVECFQMNTLGRIFYTKIIKVGQAWWHACLRTHLNLQDIPRFSMSTQCPEALSSAVSYVPCVVGTWMNKQSDNSHSGDLFLLVSSQSGYEEWFWKYAEFLACIRRLLLEILVFILFGNNYSDKY